jgi:hypothetical protein
MIVCSRSRSSPASSSPDCHRRLAPRLQRLPSILRTRQAHLDRVRSTTSTTNTLIGSRPTTGGKPPPLRAWHAHTDRVRSTQRNRPRSITIQQPGSIKPRAPRILHRSQGGSSPRASRSNGPDIPDLYPKRKEVLDVPRNFLYETTTFRAASPCPFSVPPGGK